MVKIVHRRELKSKVIHIKQLAKARNNLVDERFNSNDENLKLQAKEYERRLTDLNHEAEQLKIMQATYVLRDVFDKTIEGMLVKYEVRHSELLKASEINTNYRIEQQGKSQLTQWIPYLIMIVTTVLSLITFFKKD